MGILNIVKNFFSRNEMRLERERGSKDATAPRLGGVSLLYPNLSAMNIATVFCCVKLLSESVANLPMQHLRRKDGIFVDSEEWKLYHLLNVQPDYTCSAFDFWRDVVVEMLLEGNAYIVPIYSPLSPKVERLVLCSRGTVRHDTINDTYTVTDIENSLSGTYDEDEIIHIKGLSLRDKKNGVSVLTYARQTLNIAEVGDAETRNRFANSGTVRGIVSNNTGIRGIGEYQDEELRKTAEYIERAFRGGDNIVNLPGQTEFKQISLSSADMQFLESRKFTVIEICRFFGVPPTFVFGDTSNNYKSAEQANVAFLSRTLNPLLRNIENEFNRKLIAPELCCKYKFSFDRRELYACDLAGLMDYRTKLLMTGLTVNEVRRMDNLPPVEGGDVALVSANLRSVKDAAIMGANNPTNSTNNGKE